VKQRQIFYASKFFTLSLKHQNEISLIVILFCLRKLLLVKRIKDVFCFKHPLSTVYVTLTILPLSTTGNGMCIKNMKKFFLVAKFIFNIALGILFPGTY